MDVVSANAFLMHAGLKCNKVEFENLFDLYPGASPGCCEMDAFISEMQIDPPGAEPIMYYSGIPISSCPSTSNSAHLALSGTAHTEFGKQYKGFPKHWGLPPNTQMKGHNGVMRDLPGGYGKGNAPVRVVSLLPHAPSPVSPPPSSDSNAPPRQMANWVKQNMDKDAFSQTDRFGRKPCPYGNYSL